MTPRIKVRDLAISDHLGNSMLAATSLNADGGSIVGLTGPSGSGKTLLLSALVGHLPPTLTATGDVAVNNHRPLVLPSESLRSFRRQHTTFVSQDPAAALTPTMSVGALIMQTAAASTDGPADWLARLDLPANYLHRRVGQLSGGEQRRVALARGLARGNSVVLLDEPFTGLDGRRRDMVSELLRGYAKTHNAVLVVTAHDVPYLTAFADQAIAVAGTHRPATISTPEPPAAGPVLLTAQRLRVVLGLRTLVDDGCLTLAAGSATALIGESGAGKSTLARLLAGLPTRKGTSSVTGAITLHPGTATPAGARRARVDRRRVQLIPQDPMSALNPRKTVRQTLDRPLRIAGTRDAAQRRARTAALLDTVGLAQHHLERYPHQLSGGQRQRVAIARALAVEPKVLVCDEITSALDARTTDQIIQLLHSTAKANTVAVLLITHDLHLAYRACQRTYRLHDGRIQLDFHG